MAKVELELNEETLQRARRSAEAEHATLEQWLTEAIERTAAPLATNTLLGLFSDAPDVIDAVTEGAMTAREQHPLRQAHG
ncbi:MAG: hypothetical protein M3Y13_13205 [Armatimonadota bacterium]|nr:hypothetical protein [Armatimonadota bacterium]